MGEEDDTVDGGGVRLTCGVQRAVAASEADGCVGVGVAQGRLWAARALERLEGLAGRLGWLAGTGRAGQACEAFFFPFSFSVFFFFFLDLNSNLVIKFGFQIGAPYSLDLLSIS